MSKLVLVLNCGSSSLKFAVIDAVNGDEHISGLAECFNLEDARIKWKLNGEKGNADLGAGAAHSEALDCIVNTILPAELTEQLVAVGHRIVSGGEKYTKSMIATDEVIQGIEDCSALAPLHNPAHLIGIQAAKSAFPSLPQTVVFDTAFHQTMPKTAYAYAIPQNLHRDHGIRRYGAHGTSHQFVSEEAAKALGKANDETNVITCHLGNGGSVAAVLNGKCVDTSMGLTPLEGIVMGTRSGDIDANVVFYMVNNLGYSLDKVHEILHKESGLLGLSEKTNDCRGIEEGYEAGDEGCTLALEVFCYRLAKYVASYTVPLKRVDAIVFTGGIGENSDLIRKKVLEHLSIFGYEVDDAKNTAARFGAEGTITKDGSPIAMVIPTNEEFVIASESLALL